MPRHMVDECFFGSVTVGERGQVVIPADVRKILDIEAGDRLLVLLHPTHNGLMLTKFDEVEQVIALFQKSIAAMENETAAVGAQGEVK